MDTENRRRLPERLSTVLPVTEGEGVAVEQAGTVLAERIAERRAGVGDPRALVGEMRRAVLLVPLAGGGLWSAHSGGVRWICAFTDEAALARFAVQHGPGDQSMEYAALLGARIVDEIEPSLGEPAGLAAPRRPPLGALREARRAPPATPEQRRKTAGHRSFAAGSRIATHSTWWVIGNRSNTRNIRTRYPPSRKYPRSRASAAGSHAT